MNRNKHLKVICITVVLLLLFFVGIPLVLEHFIFRNNVYSALTNGEWSSFLGSYIGGIVGGAGTLIAMYVTTKSTRKIQEENLNQLKEDRSLEDRKERKQFADEIAKDVASYITNISQYYYANRWSWGLQQKKEEATHKLKQIRINILKEYDILENLDIENDIEEYNRAEIIINKLKVRESDAELKLSQVMDEIEKDRADRTIAVERYFVLKIKLQNVKEAKELLEKLESIHNVTSFETEGDLHLMDTETKLLKDFTVEFISKNVDQST